MRGVSRTCRLAVLAAVLLVAAVPTVGAVDPIETAEEATGQDLPEPLPTDPSDAKPGDAGDEPYDSCTTALEAAYTALPDGSHGGDVEPCRELCDGALDALGPSAGQGRDADCPDGDDVTDLTDDDPAVDAVALDVPALDVDAELAATDHDGARLDAVPATRASVQSAQPGFRAPPSLPGSMLLTLATVAVAVLVPLLVLYRRITKDDVLDHDLRQRIVDAVEDDPGATAAAIAREVGVHYMTARYHLRLLEEFDEIARRETGGRIKFFPNHGRWGRKDQVVHDALDSKKRRRLVTALLRDDELPAGELADRLDCARSTASFHLDRLVESGILDRRRDGRSIRYRVCDDVRSRVVERIVDG